MFSLFRSPAFSVAAHRVPSVLGARSFAHATIVGNLAGTPQTHKLKNGDEVVKYVVASDSGPKSNKTTSWFRVTSFMGPPTDEFLKGLKKGSRVLVEGDLSNRTFASAEGTRSTHTFVTQRFIELLSRGERRSRRSAGQEAQETQNKDSQEQTSEEQLLASEEPTADEESAADQTPAAEQEPTTGQEDASAENQTNETPSEQESTEKKSGEA